MDKFLKLLLETENTVIIPSFGAIVVENENSGKLMFNEYLTYNDGKLNQIILDNSTMNEQEAQNYIAKYVREVGITLDKGETYDIYELGSFSKDEDGKVEFTGNKHEFSPKNDTEASLEEPKPAAEEKTKDLEVNEPIEQVEELESNISNEATKEEEVSSKDVTNEVDAEENEPAESVKENTYIPPIDPSSNNEDNLLVENREDEKVAETTVPPVKTKSSKLKYLILILLLVVGAGATFIGLNYDEVKSYMGWDKFDEANEVAQMNDASNEMDKEEVLTDEEPIESASDEVNGVLDEDQLTEEKIQEDEIVEDAPAVEETPSNPEPTSVKATATSGDFHLIAGTFSERANAEKLVLELQDKGLSAKIIGPFNNMHYVSAASFDSHESATTAAPGIRDQGISVWTYKQPF